MLRYHRSPPNINRWPFFEAGSKPGQQGNSNWDYFFFSTIFQTMNITWFIYVIYWPSTEPSIKRCIGVNKRKNSGSRWTLDNNITWCPDGLSQSETGCQRENQLADWGLWALSDPRLSNPAKMRKKCCYGQEGKLGQYSSPSPTYLSHHRNINPFENKVWEMYFFYKEVCSFVCWSRHYSRLCFP